MGHRDIRVADRNARRLARVCEVTGARAVTLEPARPSGGIRFAIEATGSTAALLSLLDCMAGGGAIALVGIMHGRIDLDPNLLVEREVSLIGCHAFRDELPEAIALLARVAPQARRAHRPRDQPSPRCPPAYRTADRGRCRRSQDGGSSVVIPVVHRCQRLLRFCCACASALALMASRMSWPKAAASSVSSLAQVDGPAYVSLEAGVEELLRIAERGTASKVSFTTCL